MRRGVLVLAVLTLAACTSTPVETVPEPETVETCDGLVDVGVQLARAYVRVLEEVRTDALLAEELPPEFVELGRISSDLDTRVRGLGCDPAELNTTILQEVGDMEAESPAAGLALEIIRGGIVSTTTSLPPGAETPGTTGTSGATGDTAGTTSGDTVPDTTTTLP